MTEPAVPAAPAANPASPLRALLARVTSGEYDLGKKDFHQFVVQEIYPRLGDGSLSLADFEKITHAYAARSDPYNKG
jgi:hypothetical protein